MDRLEQFLEAMDEAFVFSRPLKTVLHARAELGVDLRPSCLRRTDPDRETHSCRI